MATLVLSAAGMALGGSVGGSVLGISMAAIGRAAGAAVGRAIDQSLLGKGSEPVEHGRIDRFRLTGASEGASLQRSYGRMRMSGQVIWASKFQEHSETSGGGKGGSRKPQTTEYAYSVSLAVALGVGEITTVGRVWADGVELARDAYTMRVYHGTATQQPDPKIEAVEGTGNAPAYRGIVYVVFEDLDVTQFGNRVPQLSFEVHRAAQPNEAASTDLTQSVRGVAMIPGTGEYALATQPVILKKGFAEEVVTNVNTPSGETDFVASTRALTEELPRANAVSLVVSWFGNDLRCGSCKIRPMVESAELDSEDMPWSVAGVTRDTALTVPRDGDRPVYGGTPCDMSVKQAIAHMRTQGKYVTFYPFILMDQMAGNGLPDPWSDAASQPNLPWRGRITTVAAPGQPGSTDGTAAARDEVNAFFDGADGFRRFILHYAQVCKDAGGVDAFCIGSEMRSLTWIRDDVGYPAVDRLIALAAEVRAILGPHTKIGYAADWSEYHGHQPGNGDKLFHLDPLWADTNIDFIGIDNYMPLADWRTHPDHADAHWGSIYNLDYLQSNVAGGEMYDWYYHSDEAREAQIRTPITDDKGEPWVWRQKDLKNWWQNKHHNRVGGVRSETSTAWQPGMKPIWFTEYGCAAIHLGPNQPNKFLDPKSSESSLPRYSNGQRDDYVQMQYVRAMNRHFADPQNNPVNAQTGHQMVDMSKAHVWAWDARPWPAFPANKALWSDGENYARGHWLNGRSTARPLSSVVREICMRAGIDDIDVSRLHGVVRGYVHDDTDTARSALQPLMLAYGFDAIEMQGKLHFRSRSDQIDLTLEASDLALGEQGTASIQAVRTSEAEVSGRVRIAYVDADGAYEARAAEAVLPDERTDGVSGQEVSLALSSGEAQSIVERWLAEERVARDGVRFALPPSKLGMTAGDVVSLDQKLWRVDRVETAGTILCEATRIAAGIYQTIDAADLPGSTPDFAPAVPVTAIFMDLPLITGTELPYAPHVAMTSRPWPGMAVLQSATSDADYKLLETFTAPASVGITQTPMQAVGPGLWDKGPALRVKLAQGHLQSVARERLLYGANLAAIGDGSPDGWELFQFAGAELVAPQTYDLRFRLRGQAGTDAMMPSVWPVGSKVVILNDAVPQIWASPADRGIARDYRWGPAGRPQADVTWRHARLSFAGVGYRPYRVCHLRADTSGVDHRLSWVRRTRIDGDGWQGYDVPMGEAQEMYHVTVTVGGAIKRDLVVSHPNWNYSTADRTADGVTGSYNVSVAQISDRFGDGPAQVVKIA